MANRRNWNIQYSLSPTIYMETQKNQVQEDKHNEHLQRFNDGAWV